MTELGYYANDILRKTYVSSQMIMSPEAIHSVK